MEWKAVCLTLFKREEKNTRYVQDKKLYVLLR